MFPDGSSFAVMPLRMHVCATVLRYALPPSDVRDSDSLHQADACEVHICLTVCYLLARC
jgi:hypothetical protein